jgi:hypothetical protein
MNTTNKKLKAIQTIPPSIPTKINNDLKKYLTNPILEKKIERATKTIGNN